METRSSATSLPMMHIRPGYGWINDPNGIVEYDGRWHVFFQHNPAGPVHADMHWGHVSSPDLVTWTEHPVAFGPTPGGPDSHGCFSGVAVIPGPAEVRRDPPEGSGAVPATTRPLAVYSGVTDASLVSTVCVRYAEDDALDTWSEPLVVADQPDGLGVTQMRDPYVFSWQGRRWALLGAGREDGTPCLLLYSCDDLFAWRCEGVWLDETGLRPVQVDPATIWECPQLVPLTCPDGSLEWLLVLSLLAGPRLTDVWYVLGHLEDDGGRPRFVARTAARLDEGPDFYAPQLVPLPDGSALMFGWIRQESAPRDGAEAEPEGDVVAGPTAETGVAGCLTIPRVVQHTDGVVAVAAHPAVVADMRRRGAASDQVLPLVAERTPVPTPAVITLTGPEGAGAVLVAVDDTGRPIEAAREVRVEADPDGAQVWIDGEVIEVLGSQLPRTPRTIRRPGVARWMLVPGPRP